MATTKTRQQVWYDFVLQQMAAESFLDGVTDKELQAIRLGWGSNDGRVVTDPKDFKLNTRMTKNQVDYFQANWEIVHQHANDATGFSATLFKNKNNNDPYFGQYTLSFRSTEFASWEKGGDYERDSAVSTGSANSEIRGKGLAIGQIAAMEKYYAWLKTQPDKLPLGAVLNVTGYSLGGHLATVFTELHAEDVNQTYSFNGAGRGTVKS